jgi:hypothetical protein
MLQQQERDIIKPKSCEYNTHPFNDKTEEINLQSQKLLLQGSFFYIKRHVVELLPLLVVGWANAASTIGGGRLSKKAKMRR